MLGIALSVPCYCMSPCSKVHPLSNGARSQNDCDGFESKWGFPQCTGAIDRSHIPIIAPAENALDYYNRKGFHSVTLQAVVD